MHGLVLAASEASRLHSHLPDAPPLFLELRGRTLYEWQLDTLAAICDEVTVVLGHGFLDCEAVDLPGDPDEFDGEIYVRQDRLLDPPPEINLRKVRGYLASDHDVDVTGVVVPHWSHVGGAEHARLGLRETVGNVLVVDGDLVYRDYLLKTIVAEFQTRLAQEGWSVVGVDPDASTDDHTVGWNANGRISAYGDRAGHRVTGVSLLHRRHVDDAIAALGARREHPFASVFPAIEATYVPTPPDSYVAINTPRGYAEAKATVARWAQRAPRRESSARK